MLNQHDKKKLRAISHHEKALIHIGKQGLTPTVKEAFESAIFAHNLVKVTLLKSSPVTLEEVVEALESDFGCDCVAKIGKVAVFYRYHKDGRIKL